MFAYNNSFADKDPNFIWSCTKMLSFHFAFLQSIGDWLYDMLNIQKIDSAGSAAFHIVIVLICFFLCRFFYLVFKTRNSDVRVLPKQPKGKKMNTMVVIGSGGHTTEMMRLMREMTPTLYYPRIYVMASSDVSSEVKVNQTEEFLGNKAGKKCRKYTIEKIPRSREVGQSLLSSAVSTLYSILRCIPIMIRHRPELIICNGPGTCIPLCLIGFLFRTLFVTNTLIVFVESVCRVESLSVSGHILYYFADVILVQWPELEQKYNRVAYIGRL